MTKMEKEEFRDRIKALDEEEKQMAVRLFSSSLLFEELKRRDEDAMARLKAIRMITNGKITKESIEALTDGND